MKRIVITIVIMFISLSLSAQTKENIWPEGKMPDAQEHQIAAKRNDTRKSDFNPEQNRQPYLEWYQAPENGNGGCMILLSGGAYESWCNESLVDGWAAFYESTV